MKRHARILAFIALLPALASAQGPRFAPVGVVRADGALAAPPERTRAEQAAIGLGVGALVGAAAGVLYALYITHQPDVQDHSEDGLVYAVGITGGVVTGGLIGLVVGIARGR